jgi:putative ABC transport system permease protein
VKLSPLLARARSLLHNLRHNAAMEEDLDREIRAHLDLLTDRNTRLGLSPEKARRAALVELGGAEQLKERVREVRMGYLLDATLQDLRSTVRMLLKTPGFTIVVVTTLALGIGATTAIFSVINAVLLKPLPFPQSERLVSVDSARLGRTGGDLVSYPDFLDWESQNHVFDNIAAYRTTRMTLAGPVEPLSIPAVVASAGLFSVLRVTPQLGRGFHSKDQATPENVVVISDSLWRSTFGADPGILGRGISLNSKSFTIIGVMPPAFNFPIQEERVELWTTMAYELAQTPAGSQPSSENRGAAYFHAIARLAPSASVKQAQAEMDQITGALNQQYASERSPTMAVVVPQLDKLVGDVRPALLILFAAVGFVLLIACANVSNLLLARLSVRHRELSIRAALGASSSRIARQLLTENLVLSAIGTGIGLLLAGLGVRLLLWLHPGNLPRIGFVALDGPVLGFAVLTMVVTAVLFGIAPVWQVRRSQIAQSLGAGRRNTDGGWSRRVRQLLIVGELALTLVLMAGTSLLTQSLVRLQRTSPGFEPAGVLSLNVRLSEGTAYSDSQKRQFYEGLSRDIAALPGVRAAAAVAFLPLTDDGVTAPLEVDGRPQPLAERPRIAVNIATSEYLRAMGIPLKSGRGFSSGDDDKAPRVCLISEALAERVFPGENPLGKSVKPGIGDDAYQIVGVVGNVKPATLSAAPVPQLIVSSAQLPVGNMTLVVRSETSPESLISAVRNQIHTFDAGLAIWNVRTLDEYVADATLPARFNSLLLSIFAAVALVLTAVGLYGVISYSVAQRTREMGIRLALGAGPGAVRRLVVGQAATLAFVGVGVGLPAAFGLTRLMSSLLYGVSASDPYTFAGVAVVIALVALLACYVPAYRATRIDPTVALRYE